MDREPIVVFAQFFKMFPVEYPAMTPERADNRPKGILAKLQTVDIDPEMAMEIWQLVFFQPLQSQVTLACLQLINAERQKETFNTRFIPYMSSLKLEFN
ncbi:unnamed protein product [Rotaria sp. Silwood2]|nr:unnamed protein product [Rotaria sp. Silwood2]